MADFFYEVIISFTPELIGKVLRVCTRDEAEVIYECLDNYLSPQPPMLILIIIEYKKTFLDDIFPGVSDEVLQEIRECCSELIDFIARQMD